MERVCNLERYKTAAGARKAIALLRKHGIRAATEVRKLGKNMPPIFSTEKFPLWVKAKDSPNSYQLKRSGNWGSPDYHFGKEIKSQDSRRASKILEGWSRKRGDMRSLTVYPEDATLDLLDMLIHDCRQYLMIATGEIKDISEEGVLELDDPSGDIEIITLRLKRLKDQCMRMAGRRPLDWLRGIPK